MLVTAMVVATGVVLVVAGSVGKSAASTGGFDEHAVTTRANASNAPIGFMRWLSDEIGRVFTVGLVCEIL